MKVKQTQIDDLFGDSVISDLASLEVPNITIDIDSISEESKIESQLMLGNILDSAYINSNPTLKRRMTIEVENLRQLLKMRKTAEDTHDALINQISANNANTALYKALEGVQKNLMSLITKTNEVINTINQLYTAHQTKIEFSDYTSNTSDGESEDNSLDKSKSNNTFRGTKDFINAMSTSDNYNL